VDAILSSNGNLRRPWTSQTKSIDEIDEKPAAMRNGETGLLERLCAGPVSFSFSSPLLHVRPADSDIVLSRQLGATLGRPLGLRDEAFDIDVRLCLHYWYTIAKRCVSAEPA
jgi:hypothetical protein